MIESVIIYAVQDVFFANAVSINEDVRISTSTKFDMGGHCWGRHWGGACVVCPAG